MNENHRLASYCNSRFVNLEYPDHTQMKRQQLTQTHWSKQSPERKCFTISFLSSDTGNPLQSPRTNLHLIAIFPAQIPSHTLHHSANRIILVRDHWLIRRLSSEGSWVRILL